MDKKVTPEELWKREKEARDKEIREEQSARNRDFQRIFGTQKPWKPANPTK